MSVFFIVIDIAKRDEVVHRVFTLVFVVLDVMQFKHLSWIIWRQHSAIPAASNAFETIPL
jgi:hypothetical protein